MLFEPHDSLATCSMILPYAHLVLPQIPCHIQGVQPQEAAASSSVQPATLVPGPDVGQVGSLLLAPFWAGLLQPNATSQPA